MARIVNSKQIAEKQYKMYEFKEEWAAKIGSPEYGFKGLYYGPPKSGKSVELLRFCQYFAKNHGKVLFNSCEERFRKTLSDTVNAFNIATERLYFGEGLDYEELCEAIKKNRYRLVVIDSVQYMNFTKVQYKHFCEKFPRVALVIVSQINAKGECFGGKGFIHMVDFYVKVFEGEAEYRGRYIKDGYHKVVLFKKSNKLKTLFDT